MFYSHAHGERLSLHGYARIQKRFKRVSRAVTYGENQGVGRNFFAVYRRRNDFSVDDLQPVEFARKKNFAAETFYLSPYTFNDRRKPVASYMRFREILYFLGRAVLNEIS